MTTSCGDWGNWDYALAQVDAADPRMVRVWTTNNPSCNHETSCNATRVTWAINDQSQGVNADAFGGDQRCLKIKVNLTLQAIFHVGGACEGKEQCCNTLKHIILWEEQPPISNQYFKFKRDDGIVKYEPVSLVADEYAHMKYERWEPPVSAPSIRTISKKECALATAELSAVSYISGECWKLTEIKLSFQQWFDTRAAGEDLATDEKIYPGQDNFSIRLDSIEKVWVCSP